VQALTRKHHVDRATRRQVRARRVPSRGYQARLRYRRGLLRLGKDRRRNQPIRVGINHRLIHVDSGELRPGG